MQPRFYRIFIVIFVAFRRDDASVARGLADHDRPALKRLLGD